MGFNHDNSELGEDMSWFEEEILGIGDDNKGMQALAYALGMSRDEARSAYDKADKDTQMAYDRAIEQFQPYDFGPVAVANYMGGVQGYDQFQQPLDYTSSPLYQSMLDEGISAVNQGAAGSGSLYSGARGEALRDVGHQALLGAANQLMGERGQELNAYNQYMTGLQNIMGVGQQAASNIANLEVMRGQSAAELGLSEAEYLNALRTGGANAYAADRANKAAQTSQFRGGLVNTGLGMLGMLMGNQPAPDPYSPSSGSPVYGQSMGGMNFTGAENFNVLDPNGSGQFMFTPHGYQGQAAPDITGQTPTAEQMFPQQEYLMPDIGEEERETWGPGLTYGNTINYSGGY